MELVLKKLNQGLEVEGICAFRSKMTTRNTVTGIIEAASGNPYYYSEEGVLYRTNGEIVATPRG